VSLRSRRSIGFIILVIFVGAAIGTILGELVALILPAGVVQDFFTRSWMPELGPATLKLVLFELTLGLKLKVNSAGVIGIGVAIYLLRWVLN
jgi:hypothetical protein